MISTLCAILKASAVFQLQISFFGETIGYNCINPRRPRGVPPPPRQFSRDCSGAACDRELKRGTTDSPFKPDVVNCFSFSGQVRSLTYDVINKPHGHKMPQLHNAANDRQSLSERWNFQKVTSPWVLTFCLIFHVGHLKSGQSRDLAHYKPTGKYWNCSFLNINDIIGT